MGFEDRKQPLCCGLVADGLRPPPENNPDRYRGLMPDPLQPVQEDSACLNSARIEEASNKRSVSLA